MICSVCLKVNEKINEFCYIKEFVNYLLNDTRVICRIIWRCLRNNLNLQKIPCRTIWYTEHSIGVWFRKNVIWNVLFPTKSRMGFQFCYRCKRSAEACPGCKLKSNGNQITRRGKRHVIYHGERCHVDATHWNVY